MELWQRFTPRARRVVLLAHTEAQRSRVQLISTEHLLMGLLRLGDGMAVEALDMAGVDLDKLRSDLEERMEVGGIEETSRELSFTPDATQVLQLAYAEARHLGDAHIGTEHLLLGLLRLGKGPAYRTLQRYGLDLRRMRHVMRELSESESGRTEEGRKSKTPHLDQFSRDLTELARRGKLDPVIGREPEIERIMQVLCRRTKNNPALLGDAGVGKTAIVEGLAQRIAHNEVPDLLKDRRLVALDLASLVAGTKYRGEFEERMKRVMEEIRDSEGQIIIFLDELHAMVGTGAAEGAMDASNILKPALARGELQCIGASTLDEYRKYIEKTPSLERRFQPITIREPTDEQTMQILEGIKGRYEDFHRVCYMPDALEAAVQLSNRYITDRAQPDKAIDLVDESGSRVKLRQYKMTTSVEALTQGLSEAEAETATVVSDYEELQADYAEAPDEQAEEVPYVCREDIGQVVSTWTGIPVTSLTQEESGRLLDMEEAIHEDVVGQDEAVSTVARAVRRARAGIKDPRRPTGSFIFLGPTGVGKTLLARVLARFLFGDEDALIRIDMSEYMERFAVSRLTGAPPGYVGYEESGQLTEQVRRRPYCVVLFDEIEKAHPEVFSILLQIMEDGRLTDAQGRVVDFKNAVVIMTSNVGARMITETTKMGFAAAAEEPTVGEEDREYERMKKKVTEELRKTFSPEFLNRVDDIVVFRALTREQIDRIIDLELRNVRDQLSERGLVLSISDELRDHLVEEGYEPSMGARPLRRAIRRIIEDPLAEHVLNWGEEVTGDIQADYRDGEVVFELVKHSVVSP